MSATCETASLIKVSVFSADGREAVDPCREETVFNRPCACSKQEIAAEALTRLEKLASSWQRERIYQEGIFTVIAGRPNAGKSSLFNSLLREDRSIVTEIPGTTRDWIEAWVSIEGIPVRLADTAGLHVPGDPVEKLGVQRSRELLDDADLILYIVDGTAGLHDEDREIIANITHAQNIAANTGAGENRQVKPQGAAPEQDQPKPVLLLWNKADLEPTIPPLSFMSINPICISAKTGEGIHELSRAIAAAVQSQQEKASDDANTSQAAALGTVRQKNLIDAACAAVREALLLADKQQPLDLIAPLLRDAVNSLGEITGEVSTADILEEMFSRFCVGK